MKVNGEYPFQIPTDSFAVSPTSAGFTLEYSADGISYSSSDAPTEAGEVLIVRNAAKNMYWRLAGNADNDIFIQY